MEYRRMTDEELREADHAFAKTLDPDLNAVFEACYALRKYAESQRKLIRQERWRRATIARWALQTESNKTATLIAETDCNGDIT